MSDYTICAAADVPDVFGGCYPGAMRFLTEALDARQVALTHHRARTLPRSFASPSASPGSRAVARSWPQRRRWGSEVGPETDAEIVHGGRDGKARRCS